MNKIQSNFICAKEYVRENEPTILLVTGLVSIGVAVISGIIASFKAAKIKQKEDMCAAGELSAKEHRKNVAKEIAGYIPCVVSTGIAVACFAGDHAVLTSQRNAAVLAYATLLTEYTALKDKYIEEAGTEKAKTDIRQIEDAHENRKAKQSIASGKFFFAEGFSKDWRPNADLNRDYLKVKEGMLNLLLQSRGHLFVNDVLTELGFPEVAYGQIAGWIYDEKHPTGDNIISFGIFDDPLGADEDTLKFLRGDSTDVIISLNYDGDIVTGVDNFANRQGIWRDANE